MEALMLHQLRQPCGMNMEFGHSSGRHASHTYTHSLSHTCNPVRKRVSVLVLKMLMSHAQRVNIVVLKGLLSYCVLSRADIISYFLRLCTSAVDNSAALTLAIATAILSNSCV